MTTDILKDWLKDLPMQFLGKKNIEVLIKAFAKQMQELDVVFDELNSKTELDTATGQNLDYIGTIVPLTRKEAGELAGIGVTEPVMEDERFRQFLKYKLLKNTSDCTYFDIMQSIEILWGIGKAERIQYLERPSRPAAIFLVMPKESVDSEMDPMVKKVLAVKPAGVTMIYDVNYVVIIDNSCLEDFRLKARFYMKIMFWPCRTYDGSVHYGDCVKYNATRGPGQRLGLWHGLQIYDQMPCLENFQVYILKFPSVQKIAAVLKTVYFLKIPSLNGQVGVKMHLHLKAAADDTETCSLAVETRRENRYNGKRAYGCGIKYNAFIRKEKVE